MEGFRSLYRVRVRNKGCDGWGIRVWLEVFGLFPRARGTRGFIHQPAASLRFIPAGAGNTDVSPTARHMISVYPRWRGEHTRLAIPFSHYDGLSPLARGTLVVRCQIGLAVQFIPAGAGNTLRWRLRPENHSVYPRWRGEHAGSYGLFPVHDGLSPLARGTLHMRHFDDLQTRFIPAGAGNTLSTEISELKISVYPRWRGEHQCSTKE